MSLIHPLPKTHSKNEYPLTIPNAPLVISPDWSLTNPLFVWRGSYMCLSCPVKWNSPGMFLLALHTCQTYQSIAVHVTMSAVILLYKAAW